MVVVVFVQVYKIYQWPYSQYFIFFLTTEGPNKCCSWQAFLSNLMFESKAGAYPSEALQGKLLSLPANIRLGCKRPPRTNTLALLGLFISCEETAPGCVFTTPHFLRNLRMCQIS
jgi:hypothetical protein